jgi:hypothetical protein
MQKNVQVPRTWITPITITILICISREWSNTEYDNSSEDTSSSDTLSKVSSDKLSLGGKSFDHVKGRSKGGICGGEGTSVESRE